MENSYEHRIMFGWYVTMDVLNTGMYIFHFYNPESVRKQEVS